MLPLVFVCLSTEGGPMWQLPMMHWTSLDRDPSVLTLPSAGHGTSLDKDPSLRPLLMISGYLFIFVHFRTLQLTSVGSWSTTVGVYGQYASYRNVVLLVLLLILSLVFLVVQDRILTLKLRQKSSPVVSITNRKRRLCKTPAQHARSVGQENIQCEETSLMACGLSVDIIGMQKHRRKSR